MRDIQLTPPPRDAESPRAGKRDIQLTPPPRAGATPLSPASRHDEGHRGRVWATAAAFAVLLAAAVAVFGFLPRWVETRQQAAAQPSPASTETGPKAEATQIATPERAGPEAIAPESSPSQPVEALAVEPPPTRETPRPGTLTPTPLPAGRERRERAPPPTRETPAPADGYVGAMSAGLEALGRQDWAAAREALARAEQLRPGEPQTADAMARAEAGLRAATIATLRQKATALEAEERWRDAAGAYEAVLALDPAVAFAQTGRARSREREAVMAKLSFHLKNPQRLSSASVLEEAATLAVTASELEPTGPRLRQDAEALGRLVEAYSTPVLAVLESDGLTEVTVYKVGRLGTFSRHQLELRPGNYTVVGSRRGYRDVRRQLIVAPGEEPQPLVVRCEARI